MSGKVRLVVRAPALSAAGLSDLLDTMVSGDDRLSFDDGRAGSHLDADPATVALVGVAGVAVSELIKLVVTRYLDARRARATTPVTVVVHLTLGGHVAASVSDGAELDDVLAKVPADHGEIARLDLS